MKFMSLKSALAAVALTTLGAIGLSACGPVVYTEGYYTEREYLPRPGRVVYEENLFFFNGYYYYDRHHRHRYYGPRPMPRHIGGGHIQPGPAPYYPRPHGHIQPGPAPYPHGRIQPGPAPFPHGHIQPGPAPRPGIGHIQPGPPVPPPIPHVGGHIERGPGRVPSGHIEHGGVGERQQNSDRGIVGPHRRPAGDER